MDTRLPPHAHARYQRGVRNRADRWGFILVVLAFTCGVAFVGDKGAISLQWVTTLPASLGFTMFIGHPVRRYQGYTPPLNIDTDRRPTERARMY